MTAPDGTASGSGPAKPRWTPEPDAPVRGRGPAPIGLLAGLLSIDQMPVGRTTL